MVLLRRFGRGVRLEMSVIGVVLFGCGITVKLPVRFWCRGAVAAAADLALILLSRTPVAAAGVDIAVSRREAGAPPPLVLEPIDHVLDALELASGCANGAGTGRGRTRWRPRWGRSGAQSPTARGHRLERRAVRGRRQLVR